MITDKDRFDRLWGRKDKLSMKDKFVIEKMYEELKTDKYFVEEGHIRVMNLGCIFEGISRKNSHLLPFQFGFDPRLAEESNVALMDKLNGNPLSFMIWVTWRTKHLLGSHQDLERACNITAKLIDEKILLHNWQHYFGFSFTDEQKKEIVRPFNHNLGESYASEDEQTYWDESVFPFIEREKEFYWMVTKEEPAVVYTGTGKIHQTETEIERSKPEYPDDIRNGV